MLIPKVLPHQVLLFWFLVFYFALVLMGSCYWTYYFLQCSGCERVINFVRMCKKETTKCAHTIASCQMLCTKDERD
ncbi:maker432 [Drosophila busckii]|uniref:Maker432 n=1 Tax=Drosophila busckii TaxID=30019 RepID=A0A0M4E461_DROBS|nr:maker432 [Drosophila busckii]